MMAAAWGALALLGLLSMALGIQQAIRLIRWARELAREADRLEHPGEH